MGVTGIGDESEFGGVGEGAGEEGAGVDEGVERGGDGAKGEDEGASKMCVANLHPSACLPACLRWRPCRVNRVSERKSRFINVICVSLRCCVSLLLAFLILQALDRWGKIQKH